MSLELQFTCDVVEAHYDADNAWLYWDWKGPLHTPEVVAACRQLFPLIRQTGARKLLNDNSRVTENSWELAMMTANLYLPDLDRAGITHVAWVCPSVLDARNRIEVGYLYCDNKPELLLFDDLATACTWLSSAVVKPVGSNVTRPLAEY